MQIWCQRRSPFLAFAMAQQQRKKKGRSHALDGPPTALDTSLERSMVINREGLDKVRRALAADSNEWKATTIRPCLGLWAR